MYIEGILLLGFLTLISACSRKNEYPPEATQGFMNECEKVSGATTTKCACMLEQFQAKYNYEDFSVIDTKLKMNQPVGDDYIKFMNKAGALCNKA